MNVGRRGLVLALLEARDARRRSRRRRRARSRRARQAASARGRRCPPWQPASGAARQRRSCRARSRSTGRGPHSLESSQSRRASTHFWNEQTCPPPQHTSPHALVAAQQTSPAHTPPSPHGAPVGQLFTSAKVGASSPASSPPSGSWSPGSLPAPEADASPEPDGKHHDRGTLPGKAHDPHPATSRAARQGCGLPCTRSGIELVHRGEHVFSRRVAQHGAVRRD